VIASYKEDIETQEYFLIPFYLKDENALSIVEEGNKYYFGDIKFLGNTVYPDQLLSRIIGVGNL
jgi:outer membrane protein insertion porin family